MRSLIYINCPESMSKQRRTEGNLSTWVGSSPIGLPLMGGQSLGGRQLRWETKCLTHVIEVPHHSGESSTLRIVRFPLALEVRGDVEMFREHDTVLQRCGHAITVLRSVKGKIQFSDFWTAELYISMDSVKVFSDLTDQIPGSNRQATSKQVKRQRTKELRDNDRMKVGQKQD